MFELLGCSALPSVERDSHEGGRGMRGKGLTKGPQFFFVKGVDEGGGGSSAGGGGGEGGDEGGDEGGGGGYEGADVTYCENGVDGRGAEEVFLGTSSCRGKKKICLHGGVFCFSSSARSNWSRGSFEGSRTIFCSH